MANRAKRLSSSLQALDRLLQTILSTEWRYNHAREYRRPGSTGTQGQGLALPFLHPSPTTPGHTRPSAKTSEPFSDLSHHPATQHPLICNLAEVINFMRWSWIRGGRNEERDGRK